jgi:ABC-type branched-subunit amino acid transport system permease subunit
MVGSGSSGGWLTAPMVITLIALASLPFWIEQVGLYQYLGVEVIIWMIYALGFNLLLGLSGLPSFGHGAYFGIGAMPSACFSCTPSRACGLALAPRSPAGWSPAPSSPASCRTAAASISRS